MKTHHWAGATLSMKNFFGLVPGSVYGWPKNELHHIGIPRSIVELNRVFRRISRSSMESSGWKATDRSRAPRSRLGCW